MDGFHTNILKDNYNDAMYYVTYSAEQEAKWQNGEGRLMRDFANFKELYTVRVSGIQK